MLPRLLTLTAAIGLIASAPARAEFEVNYAYVDEIDHHSTQGFVGSWLRPIERWNEYHVYSEVLVGGILGRDGFPGRDDEDVFFAGAGLRKHWGGFFLGAGLVALDHQNSLLSSIGQIVTSMGYTRGPVVIAFRHISNGNLAGNNDGENLLTLGYRW